MDMQEMVEISPEQDSDLRSLMLQRNSVDLNGSLLK